MNAYYILLCIILVLLLILLYYESSHIYYHIKCLLSSKNTSGLPTPTHIRSKITTLIKELPPLSYTLIDFGCGDGDFINHIHHSFHHTVGIELDKEQAEFTRKRFYGMPTIDILTMNMIDYDFPRVPHVLYMYEPLWKVSRDEALTVYHTVMKNVSSSHLYIPSYIIYVSGIHPILDETFFSNYPYTMVHHSRARRILGWNANHIYLFKRHL
jgi:hypothetical protein